MQNINVLTPSKVTLSSFAVTSFLEIGKKIPCSEPLFHLASSWLALLTLMSNCRKTSYAKDLKKYWFLKKFLTNHFYHYI
jgi:hypothetical protein